MKTVANIASIWHGKILLCLKKNDWILPGGKHEPGEDDLSCIIRECSEEIPKADLTTGEYFGSFTGISPNSKSAVEARVYLGQIIGDISPSGEISQVCYFEKFQLETLQISQITKEIINKLIQEGHL